MRLTWLHPSMKVAPDVNPSWIWNQLFCQLDVCQWESPAGRLRTVSNICLGWILDNKLLLQIEKRTTNTKGSLYTSSDSHQHQPWNIIIKASQFKTSPVDHFQEQFHHRQLPQANHHQEFLLQDQRNNLASLHLCFWLQPLDQEQQCNSQLQLHSSQIFNINTYKVNIWKIVDLEQQGNLSSQSESLLQDPNIQRLKY